MNVALLGGSFNPPHIGHALIATQTLELFEIDQVWLLPTYQHAFDKKLIDTHHRLSMSKLLDTKHIKTSSFEMNQKKTNYTIDTLNSLQSKYPSYIFHFIMGSDQLESIKKWKNWEELIAKHKLIIFPRPQLSENIKTYVRKKLGFKKIPQNILIVNNKNLIQIEISSTIIRERIRQKKNY